MDGRTSSTAVETVTFLVFPGSQSRSKSLLTIVSVSASEIRAGLRMSAHKTGLLGRSAMTHSVDEQDGYLIEQVDRPFS